MSNEHKSLAAQIGNKCRHFNGIDKGTCKAGVRFIDVRDISTMYARWPCFKDDGCADRCALVSYFSEQEVAEREAESSKAIATFLAELNEGKTCPHCHAPITELYQVGRCVYNRGCRCRQYQGVVPKDKRTPKDQREINEQNSLWGAFGGGLEEAE